jgi:hypothetical protein
MNTLSINTKRGHLAHLQTHNICFVGAMAPKGVKKQSKHDLQEQAAKQAEADAKKSLQSGLIMAGKTSPANSDRGLAYAAYCASPKFSAERDKILGLFKADKSCKWVATVSRVKSFDQSSKQSGSEGVCAKCSNTLLRCLQLSKLSRVFQHSVEQSFHSFRYELAGLLSMTVESPGFDFILAEIPSLGPESWSDENPVHRGYKAANLRQYDVSYVRGLVDKSAVETEKDEMTLHSHRDTKENPFGMLTAGGSSASSVKLEVPQMADLNNLVPNLNKQSRDLLTMASSLRVQSSQLKASKKAESATANLLITK